MTPLDQRSTAEAVSARKTRSAESEPRSDRPWLKRMDWRRQRLAPASLFECLLYWGGLALYIALVIPFVLAIRESAPYAEGWVRTVGSLTYGVILGIGIFLLYVAIRSTLRYRRFGKSDLILETLPGRIGGDLRVRLVIRGRLSGLRKVRVDLQCKEFWESTERRSSQNTSKRKGSKIIYADREEVEVSGVAFDTHEVEVPVAFSIPLDVDPTGPVDRGRSDRTYKIQWRMRARASLPGANLDLKYIVPVFDVPAEEVRTGEFEPAKRAPFTADLQAAADAFEPPRPDLIMPRANAHGGSEYVVRAKLDRGGKIFFTITAGGFGTLAGLLAYWSFTETLMAWPFALIVSLLALLFLALLVSCSGRWRVTITPDAVRRRWTVCGLPLLSGSKHREGLSKFDYDQFMRGGGRTTYRLYAEDESGDTFHLANMIPSKEDAAWLIARLEEATGLHPGDPRA